MSNPLYYPNRDMLASGFPANWTLLKRLMWVRIMRGGSIAPTYETVTGNPVSFQTVRPAPLKQLSVAFSPVQDLHGYDSPWPAGGGKNKLPITATTQTINDVKFTVNADGTITVNGTATANATFTVYGANVSSSDDIPITSQSIISTDTSDIVGVVWKSGAGTTFNNGSYTIAAGTTLYGFGIRVLSGTTANNVLVKPMLRLSSESSTFAPYSNLCPISGWSSLTVEQTGVNVWDEEWEVGGINHTTGQNNDSVQTVIRSKNYIPCSPSTSYYFIVTGAENEYIHYYDENKTFISYVNPSPNTVFTTPNNAHYIRFNISANYGTTYKGDISINYPSTDHDYHAYNPLSRSISISLGSTVYSGTVDVVTGVVKARPYYASYNGETLVGPWMSSMDKYVAGATPTVGAQVVDMGGAETTIQLTPQEVESLLGDNVLFSDANGDLTVEYRSN